MSRKEPTFAQLIDYMTDTLKSDTKFHVYHNLFTRNNEQLKEAFEENAQFVRKHKNANYMYHEILSITKSKKLGIKAQKEALRQIAYEYTQMRASKNLVFGCIHNDHEGHLHYHLLISANEAGQSKKTRLSKAQFDQVKKQIEQNVLSRYPELEQTMIINKRPSEESEKLSRKAGEQKRRTGTTPQRDELKAKLRKLFKQAKSKDAFFTGLSEANLELYIRGKTIGVKDVQNNRKHRLKTLGLLAEFEACSKRVRLDEMKNSSSDKPKKETQAKEKIDTKTNQSKTAQSETAHTEKKAGNTKDSQKQTTPTQSSVDSSVAQARIQRKIEMEQWRSKQSQSDSQSQDSQGQKKGWWMEHIFGRVKKK